LFFTPLAQENFITEHYCPNYQEADISFLIELMIIGAVIDNMLRSLLEG